MDDSSRIHDRMEQTRTALSEKLEKLEDTVHEATQEVAQTVTTVTDSVQDTVHTVHDTVDDALTSVKEGIDVFKNVFDVPRHVDRHPWASMGGSVAIGFVLHELLSRSARPAPARRAASSQDQDAEEAGKHASNGHARTNNYDDDDGDGLFDRFAPELAKLKGLALGALIGMFRDMITNAAGDSLGQSLGEIIDSITTKMGGTPVPAEPNRKEPNNHALNHPAPARSC